MIPNSKQQVRRTNLITFGKLYLLYALVCVCVRVCAWLCIQLNDLKIMESDHNDNEK